MKTYIKVQVIWEVKLKATMGYYYLPSRMAKTKQTITKNKVLQYIMLTKTGKDLEKLNSIAYIFGQNENSTVSLVVSYKIKHILTYVSGILPR